MRYNRSVFYYVDFVAEFQQMLTMRAFVYVGKGGREWLDSSLENARSLDEIRNTLRRRYRGKLRSVGLEFDPEVVRVLGCAKMELIEID